MKCNSPEFVELSNEILTRGNRLRFRAHGKSMHPFINDGDIIEIEPVDTKEIRRGDVIFYRKSGRAFLHRMRKKIYRDDKQVFIAKGDSILGCGEEVRMEDILGKAVALERNGRKIRFDGKFNGLMNIFYGEILPFGRRIYHMLQKDTSNNR